MFGGTVLDIQARAVLHEYQEALEDRDMGLVYRIWEANPDLHKALRGVEEEVLERFSDDPDLEEWVIRGYIEE